MHEHPVDECPVADARAAAQSDEHAALERLYALLGELQRRWPAISKMVHVSPWPRTSPSAPMRVYASPRGAVWLQGARGALYYSGNASHRDRFYSLADILVRCTAPASTADALVHLGLMPSEALDWWRAQTDELQARSDRRKNGLYLLRALEDFGAPLSDELRAALVSGDPRAQEAS